MLELKYRNMLWNSNTGFYWNCNMMSKSQIVYHIHQHCGGWLLSYETTNKHEYFAQELPECLEAAWKIETELWAISNTIQ